jgi:uncharacterized lipoprotein YmbA
MMVLHTSGSGEPIPVLIHVEPGRLLAGDNPAMVEAIQKSLEIGVTRGLRATLATGSLITGSMYIEFDYYPDEPPAELGVFKEYTTIPSISGGLSRIEHQVSALLNKVNQLPLEQTVTGANQTIAELNTSLAALNTILERSSTQDLTAEIQATLEDMRAVLAGISPNSEAYQSLNASLLELNRTLQNLSDFSRTLSDQPNSLVMPVDTGELNSEPAYALGRVQVATYIDQPGLVQETGGGEIHVARHHRWAEPLRVSLRRFLAMGIGAELGQPVALMATSVESGRVDVTIDQLHGNNRGEAVLVAFWEVSAADGAVTSYQFSETRALSRDGYTALAEAEEALLQQLARRIGQSIR